MDVKHCFYKIDLLYWYYFKTSIENTFECHTFYNIDSIIIILSSG